MIEQKLLIDGKSISVKLAFMRLEQKLIEVTCVSDSFRNYITSGVRYIELDGMASTGKKIQGVFQLLEHVDDIFIIKSIHE